MTVQSKWAISCLLIACVGGAFTMYQRVSTNSAASLKEGVRRRKLAERTLMDDLYEQGKVKTFRATADFAALSLDLNGVKGLHVSDCYVGEALTEKIRTSKLEAVHLSRTQVSPKLIEVLSELGSLKCLVFADCRVKCDLLKPLAKSGIDHLTLVEAPDSSNYEWIKQLRNLKVLRIVMADQKSHRQFEKDRPDVHIALMSY